MTTEAMALPCIVGEFEEVLTSHDQSTAHHEDAYPLQVKFLKDLKYFSAVLHEQGNLFLDGSHKLVTMGTRDVIEH